MIDGVISDIRRAERLKEDVDTLVNSLDKVRKEGASVKLYVYNASGCNYCIINLVDSDIEKVFDVLIDGYNERIKEIKKEVSKYFDSLVDESGVLA